MLYHRLFLLFIWGIGLGGCTTTLPPNISLRIQAPSIEVPIKSTSIEVAIQDERKSPALIDITYSSSNKKAILPSANLMTDLKDAFQQSLTTKGYEIGNDAQAKLTIVVNTLKMDVNQSNLKHTMLTNIALQAIIIHQKKRFKKTYHLKIKTEGTLAVAVADIRNNLSRQLNSVIRSMLNDAELHKAFNQIK